MLPKICRCGSRTSEYPAAPAASHPILRWVTGPEREKQYQRAQGEGVLVDGFVVPVGEREGYDGLFSGKKHLSGQNVQVVADLDGHVADVGDPVPGARHDAVAFFISG